MKNLEEGGVLLGVSDIEEREEVVATGEGNLNDLLSIRGE